MWEPPHQKHRMKGKITTYLLVLTALTACTADDNVGGDPLNGYDESVIGFAPGVEAVTRAATGKTAADSLGGTFYVYAIKNEDKVGAGNVDNANLVFNNYKVSYLDGSANTTISNTADWDYVGLTLSTEEQANITDNSGMHTQSVKYWDYNANDYTFYAFSAKSDDIKDGKVRVTKTTSKTGQVYDDGYTVSVAADADLSKLYFANRLHIDASPTANRNVTNDFGGRVQFTFSKTLAKVRVGMYETIPGYTVTIDGFEVVDDATPTFGAMTSPVTGKFAANLASNKPGTAGTMTVTYSDNTAAIENRPVVEFAGDNDKDAVLYLGDNLKEKTVLKTTAADLVYDKANGGYTEVFPMEGNVNNLKLKVDYTLKSTVGETITVKGATAEVPAQYLQWKPGCAYTYIFKVSNQTNGVIGSLTGLHPITFEAVSIVDGTGEDELITTTTPTNYNIITIGCNETTHKVTVGKDDYNVGDAVYAVVVAADAVATDLATTTRLYEVTTSDDHSYPITEASVENYLALYEEDNTLIDQPVTAIAVGSGVASYVTTVPKGDETSATSNLNAMKWTAERKVYAVEYTVPTTTSTSKAGTKYYKVVRIGGFGGQIESTLALSPNTVGNIGATLTPTLTIGGDTIDNAEVTYTLDTAGKYGTAVPSTVTVNADNTITVAGSTDPGTYTVIATYRRRTYTTTFTVSQ